MRRRSAKTTKELESIMENVNNFGIENDEWPEETPQALAMQAIEPVVEPVVDNPAPLLEDQIKAEMAEVIHLLARAVAALSTHFQDQLSEDLLQVINERLERARPWRRSE
jgi:hypothetical protein